MDTRKMKTKKIIVLVFALACMNVIEKTYAAGPTVNGHTCTVTVSPSTVDPGGEVTATVTCSCDETSTAECSLSWDSVTPLTKDEKKSTSTKLVATGKPTDPGTFTVMGSCNGSKDSAYFTVNCKDDKFSKHTISAGFQSNTLSAINQIRDKAQAAIRMIPGLGDARCDSVEGVYSMKAKDCCKDNERKTDGTKYKQATAGITLDVGKGIKLWPGPQVPDISKKFDLVVAEVDVVFSAGVYLGGSFSLEGTVGARTTECTENGGCAYASFAAKVKLALTAKIEAIACVESLWTDKKCAGLTITPGELSCSITGKVSYNSEDSCDGIDGEFKIGQIMLSAEFNIPGGIAAKWEYEVFAGF